MKPLSLGNALCVLNTRHQLTFEGHRSQRAPGHGQLWVTTEGTGALGEKVQGIRV